MPEILVTAVRANPADDLLFVDGYVDGVPVWARGWISWTENYYDAADHPADPDLESLEGAKREKALQKHRDAIAAIRRPMTPDELRGYCVDLLKEAAGIHDDHPVGFELDAAPPADDPVDVGV